MDEATRKLMPLRMKSMIVELIEDEYDRLANEAVTAAVKDKCNKEIKIDNMEDFTKALNDLRDAGYMIKYVIEAASQKGEFRVYKIAGGMML